MNRKSKKSIIALVAIIAATCCFTLVAAFVNPNLIPPLYERVNTDRQAYISEADFNRYFSDFEAVANEAVKYHQEVYNSPEIILDYDPDKPAELYDYNEEVTLRMEGKQSDSLAHINEAFKNGGQEFYQVTVDHEYVFFQIKADIPCFTVIYSRDGKVPEYLTGYVYYSFYSRYVKKDWYFLTGTPPKETEEYDW
jgi:hypothetical protein